MRETQGRLVDIGAVVAGLAACAPELVRQLLPQGARQGAEWVVPARSSPFGCSVSVHLNGSRAGVWCAWAAGEAGDALDLVASVRFGGDKRRALQWAREWLALDSPLPAVPPAPQRQSNARRVDEARTGAALRLFLEAQPAIAGTAAGRYLERRGIDLGRLGRQPRALRFHPELFNAEAKRFFPALIAGIANGAGEMVAVHRTWLKPDGSGKADLANPKMALGPFRGACIRLWRGASGKPLREAPDGETALISEGIEDGLSAAVAAPEHRVLCAVSVSNIGAVELTPAIRTVIILAQNDAPGSPAARTIERAVVRLRAQGRCVKLARPPARFKDLNEMLQPAAASP